MADGFDTIPCEVNQSDCQEVSGYTSDTQINSTNNVNHVISDINQNDCQAGDGYTFDTQIGSAYNVSRAIAEQWQVIEKLKQDIGAVADKTAVKDYNGNTFDNLTIKGENGINVDISENNPEQLDIRIDQDIIDQIDINIKNIALLENNLTDTNNNLTTTNNNLSALETRVSNTEETITELVPDVARALKIPLTAPTETKLVAVDNTNSQEMLKLSPIDFTIDPNKIIRIVHNPAILVFELLSKVYPVGSIYMSVQEVSPASFLGGTWEQLPAGYALWTADSGAGETIAAGLPNITGTTGSSTTVTSLIAEDTGGFSGAMYLNNIASRKVCDASSKSYSGGTIGFNANRSNSIYGNSTTVQPPAYKVYAWKRTA